MRLRRSALSGRFVTKAVALADPAGTVTETLPGPNLLREQAFALCLALETEGDLHHLSPQSVGAYYELKKALGQ